MHLKKERKGLIMKIIIVGCGRVGQTLAEKLNNDGNEVTVIDLSPLRVRQVTDNVDVMGVVGNGAKHTTLREAGIESADLFIAVTDSDELNLLCCIVAKKEGRCRTIARLKNPEYSADAPYLKEHLDLEMVINPEYAAAEEIARVLRFPSALKVEPFAKGRVNLIKFRLPKDSKMVGMSVRQVVAKLKVEVLVCTVERGDEAFIVSGNFVFEEKDIISIIATPKQAKEFFDKIDYKGNSIKNAMIVGGGSITHYLCEILERSPIKLKVIEKDIKVCEQLSNDWDKINVINGDGLNKSLLLEEGLEYTDAFVSLLKHDEDNILLSMFSSDLSNCKLVTRINRTDYDQILSKLNLDAVICPKNITSDMILRYVRSTSSRSSNMERLYNIIQGKVEASEFIIKANSPVSGIALKDLPLKSNVLVASITRGEKVIIPRGWDVIEEGDAVVIITSNLGLHDIAEVLEEE